MEKQQIVDLIQSIIIGLLVLRNLWLKYRIRKNTLLLVKQAEISLAQGKVLNHLVNGLKRHNYSKDEKSND